MVYYQSTPLDRTFAALSDSTRRALLARLQQQAAVSVSDLARPLPMSLPAVMKHLDVLSDAGLVTRTKSGRTVMCSLNAGPMLDASRWLEQHSRFWNEQIDRLSAFLEEETSCPPQPAQRQQPSNLPSLSPDTSTRRPRGSSRHGPIPKK